MDSLEEKKQRNEEEDEADEIDRKMSLSQDSDLDDDFVPTRKPKADQDQVALPKESKDEKKAFDPHDIGSILSKTHQTLGQFEEESPQSLQLQSQSRQPSKIQFHISDDEDSDLDATEAWKGEAKKEVLPLKNPTSSKVTFAELPAKGNDDDEEKLSPRSKVAGMNTRFNSLVNLLSNDEYDAQPDEEEEAQVDPAKVISTMDKADSDEEEEIPTSQRDDLEDISIDFWNQLEVPKPQLDNENLRELETSFQNQILEIPIIQQAVQAEKKSAIDETCATNFKHSSDEVSLVVTKVPEEVLKSKRAKLQEEANAERIRKLELTKKREADILWREHMARQRVLQYEVESQTRMKQDLKELNEKALEKEGMVNRQFRRMKEDLESFLASKQAQIKEVYGELTTTDKSLGRNYKVNWSLTPQPIEMRFHQMRACKNKLPKGAYVFMLTQYDRLGGRPLAWSKIGAYGIGPNMPAVTRPVKHYGRYFDRVLKIGHSTFALCPPRPQIKPSYVLIIELFQLATKNNPIDKIVAWAALPMCDNHFSVVEGKFRLPLLKGEHTPAVQHYWTIEKLMAEDVNNWLCNLYVEVRHLPRYKIFKDVSDPEGVLVKDEFEVEFDFMSKLLKVTNNNGQGQAKADDSGEEEDFIRSDIGAKDRRVVDKNLFKRKLTNRKFSFRKPPETESKNKDKPSKHISFGSPENKFANLSESKNLNESKQPHSKDSENEHTDTEFIERGYNSGDEFYLYENQKGKLQAIDTLNTLEERLWTANSLEHKKVARRFQSDGSRFDTEAIPNHEIIASRDKPFNISEEWFSELKTQLDYEEFSPSLCPDAGRKKLLLPSALAKSKLRFLYHEAFGDLSYSQWGNFDFYVTALSYFICLWMRMYIHYIGQYFYLQALMIPTYGFQIRPHEIIFKYMATTIPLSYEFGLVAMGPTSVLAVFFFMVLIAKMCYKYVGFLPDNVSKFVCTFGIATVLDPFLIFLVDVCAQNYDCRDRMETCRIDYTSSSCHCVTGDFIKLWNRAVYDESSGLSGLVLTILSYILSSSIATLLLYVYLIHIHKDQRILDLWRRITAPTEDLYVPYDFEISFDELRSIVKKAEMWKGPAGSTRKLVVSDYEERDPYDPTFYALTKHYAIYELEMNGQRKLYRHFLLLPDNAIIEIFDQISFDVSGQFKSLENMLGNEKARVFRNKPIQIFKGIENA